MCFAPGSVEKLLGENGYIIPNERSGQLHLKTSDKIHIGRIRKKYGGKKPENI